jgi:hypothetical protein
VSLQHQKTGTVLGNEGALTENTEQMRLLRHREGISFRGLISPIKKNGPLRLCDGAVTPPFKKNDTFKPQKYYVTIVLPVLLYECETWSLQESTKVFEEEELRKVFDFKRNDSSGQFRI